MEEPSTWEMVFIGIAMLVALLFFGPGARRALQNSRKGSGQEWLHIALILGVVVLFVFLLISLV